jgi:hypothetical protein
MTFANKLTISKPVSVWNKSIKVERGKFLKSIGKMLCEGVMQDWSDFGGAALDTLDALGLCKKPDELAWLLISRALFAALAELIKNNCGLFGSRPDEECRRLGKYLFACPPIYIGFRVGE